MYNQPACIVMPTSNQYTRYADISLALLDRHWEDHPPIHVSHFEVQPQYRGANVHYLDLGPQAAISWTGALLRFLAFIPTNWIYLILDDYALARVLTEEDRYRLWIYATAIPECSSITCVHLTPQQTALMENPETPLFRIVQPWSYSINLQAALWNVSHLRRLLSQCPNLNAWEFELQASHYHNREFAATNPVCQAVMPTPATGLLDFADSMDKTHWVFPYHNLSRQGSPDPRHREFLIQEGFNIV